MKIRRIFPHLNVVAVSVVSFVTYLEPDYSVEAMRIQKLQNVTTSWGIDRIDGKLDNKYQYSYNGKDVRVYIIDSGIQINHDEFN